MDAHFLAEKLRFFFNDKIHIVRWNQVHGITIVNTVWWDKFVKDWRRGAGWRGTLFCQRVKRMPKFRVSFCWLIMRVELNMYHRFVGFWSSLISEKDASLFINMYLIFKIYWIHKYTLRRLDRFNFIYIQRVRDSRAQHKFS